MTLADRGEEGLNAFVPPTKAALKGLIGSLEEYAAVLEWRIKEGGMDAMPEQKGK
jgi:hypothetical protein